MQSHMTKGFLILYMRKCANICIVIYREAVSHMTLHPIPSKFPKIRGKFYFLFEQCKAREPENFQIWPYEGRLVTHQVTRKGGGNKEKGEEKRDNSLGRREGQATRQGAWVQGQGKRYKRKDKGHGIRKQGGRDKEKGIREKGQETSDNGHGSRDKGKVIREKVPETRDKRKGSRGRDKGKGERDYREKEEGKGRRTTVMEEGRKRRG